MDVVVIEKAGYIDSLCANGFNWIYGTGAAAYV